MKEIGEYLKYGGHEYRRRKIYGCVGGCIGFPIILGGILLLKYVIDNLPTVAAGGSVNYTWVWMILIGGLCMMAVLAGMGLLFFLVRRRR